MIRLPARALVIRRAALEGLSLATGDLAQMMAFDGPRGETTSLLVYGPYFDFESLDEVGNRLDQAGLQYWDDYVELKEDLPEWMALAVLSDDHSPPSSGSDSSA